MRGKKKVSQVPAVEKQPQNKLKTLITKDDREFKILDSLLMKHSVFIRGLLEGERPEDEIRLIELDGEVFEYAIRFMELHPEGCPDKIHYPLKSNQDLKYVMEESDAEMILGLLDRPDHLVLFKKVLDATNYLQMEDFKKRLLAGLTIKLLRSTVGEMKEQYDISEHEPNDDELRKECRERLEHIAELKDD